MKNTIIHDRHGEDSIKNGFKNKNDEKIRKLLSEKANDLENRSFRLARSFYQGCIDHKTLDEVGKKPLLKKMDELGGWPLLSENWNQDEFDWQEIIDKMYQQGYVKNYLIHSFLSPDPNGINFHYVVIFINHFAF